MDLANPTLVYIIVCLDRSVSVAGMRLERSKMYLDMFMGRKPHPDQERDFLAFKETIDEALNDIILTSSKTAITVNETVSNMPAALHTMQFNDAVTAGYEQVKYATGKLIEASQNLETLLHMTQVYY
jgi:hypothetical protein